MKFLSSKKIIPLILLFLLALPVFTYGAERVRCSDNNGNPITTNPECSVTVQSKIDNPLGSKITSIPAFIEELLKIVLTVGVPIVALAIIYTGFLFVKAQGAPEEIKKAKSSLLYVIIGAALLLGAFVLANAIKGTVDEIKSQAFNSSISQNSLV